eukprot:3664206-Prymnesium_polylepis.1
MDKETCNVRRGRCGVKHADTRIACSNMQRGKPEVHALHCQPGQASGARIGPPARTLTAPESAAHAHNTSVSTTHPYASGHRRARRLTDRCHAR